MSLDQSEVMPFEYFFTLNYQRSFFLGEYVLYMAEGCHGSKPWCSTSSWRLPWEFLIIKQPIYISCYLYKTINCGKSMALFIRFLNIYINSLSQSTENIGLPKSNNGSLSCYTYPAGLWLQCRPNATKKLRDLYEHGFCNDYTSIHRQMWYAKMWS